MQEDYAEIISTKPVQRFMDKYCLSDHPVQNLALISPFIHSLQGNLQSLDSICKKSQEKGIPIYVITREPEDELHQEKNQVS